MLVLEAATADQKSRKAPEMPLDREIPTGDYWTGDVEPGAAESWSFEGLEGLERLTGPTIYSAPVAVDFRARLTRVQLDHVALEAFAATRHRSVRDHVKIEQYPTPVLTFMLVAEGELQVELTDSTFVLQPGQFAVLDSRDPVTLVAPTETRLLKSTIGVEHVPKYLQQRGMTIPGSLHRTSLTESFVSFVSTMLKSAAAGRPARGARIIQAVSDLQNAILAEAQQVIAEPTGPAGLRYRIEEYIETHLTDRDLDPPAIADALGISVRHAHNVFNDGQRTISRYIRDRKIARIALTLRAAPPQARLDDLATQYDFSTVEAMSRAFTERIGMSPTEYRAGGHRTLG